MTARAICITVRDPFRPHARDVRLVRGRPRVRSLAPQTERPFIAMVNGRALMRAGWRRRVRAGDVVAFVVLPQGGQQGGSNPLVMILSLAVLVAAPYLAGLALGAAGIATTATVVGTLTAGQLATSAITFAGMALVNMLVPKPAVPTSQQIAGPSPTYSIGAQGNAARIDAAIPVQYGRLRVFPDFAAQPYIEYAGNEQYLYQLLCIGQGEFDVETIQIEDTPVASFDEIETEIVPPHGEVTLFPANVTTSSEVSGQTFQGRTSGTYAQSGATVTVTETAHGRLTGQAVSLDFTSGGAPDGEYLIATVPTANTYTVTVVGSATRSGNVNVRGILGGLDGFVVNAAGTVANKIGIDLVAPRGLYEALAGGTLAAMEATIRIEARTIDDVGTPTGSWAALDTLTIRKRTTTPVRISQRYTVTPGRYQVRAWREDVAETAAEFGHEIIWAGARAYLRNTQDYGDVTLLAMRMRASNNLSGQASRKVNVIATRKLPIWNGSSWSLPTATRSIAWAIADAARNETYGAGMPDAEIDLAALLTLDATWAARGDEFNGRWDAAVSWWEAVTQIAGAGRARPFMQGGILRVVRDGAVSLPVALFSMRNIVKRSFSIDYLMPTPDTADAVEVGYFDRTVWAQRRVVAKLPGSSGAKPVKMDLFGVTDRAHALREGLYHAASNRYRRRVVKFATEMEGFIPSIGDLIAIQHDMPGWGQHAEAVAWDAATLTLTVSELLTWGDGSHYVGLRAADGGLVGPFSVTRGGRDDVLTLADATGSTIYTGGERERTHVVFGTATSWRVLAKVVAVRPRGLLQVEVEAMTEDPSVHTAETGGTAPPLVIGDLPSRFTAPRVRSLIHRTLPSDTTRALLSWDPAPGADVYQIEMAEGDDPYNADNDWTRIGDTTAAHYVVRTLSANRTLIRVRAIGLSAGPWQYRSLGTDIPFMWTSDATAMWSATSTDLMWS